eukprot:COSAG01_NODE_3393_length_6149_cov_24.742149_10_plen_78_part_00
MDRDLPMPSPRRTAGAGGGGAHGIPQLGNRRGISAMIHPIISAPAAARSRGGRELAEPALRLPASTIDQYVPLLQDY